MQRKVDTGTRVGTAVQRKPDARSRRTGVFIAGRNDQLAKDILKDLGQQLSEARASQLPRLTDQEIAEVTGLSRPTVAAALHGDPSTKLLTLLKVAEAVGKNFVACLVDTEWVMRQQAVNEGPTWSGNPSKEHMRNLLATREFWRDQLRGSGSRRW